MDHQETIRIKKEEADGLPDEPGLMFEEDPLGISWPTDLIKEEPSLHLEADETADIFFEEPLGGSWSTHDVSEDPRQNFGWDETEKNNSWNILLDSILEMEWEDCPLPVLVPKDQIVVASTRRASSSTRLIQNSDKSCDISFEETVKQKLVPNELEVCVEESLCLTMLDTHTQGLEEEAEEESLFGTRLKCSWKENGFQKFSCSFCLQSFISKYRLIMHVFIHMDDVQSPEYICTSCGEIFGSHICLNKHLNTNKCDHTTSAGQNGKLGCIHKHDNIFLEGDENYSLIEHTEKQSSEVRNEALRATRTRPHNCDVCGKCFTLLGDLDRHALIHTGIRPHKCLVCGKSFTQLCNLKRHVLIHAGVRHYICDVCGKSFTRLGDLKTHALIHAGIRPHKCDVCGKCFTQLGNLKRHALIHTGVKQHKCDVCRKSFTRLQNLKTHGLIHT